MKNVATRSIELYRSYLSRTLFSSIQCAFPHDTCSHYALHAFQQHPFRDAILKTRARLKRCGNYGIVKINNHYFPKSGIEDIVQTPDNIHSHLEKLQAADESRYVLGHVLTGAQLLHEHRYGQPHHLLEKLIGDYNVMDIQPRVRDLTNYRSELRKAAAVHSLTPLPLLTLGLLPFINKPLLLASVAAFVGQYWWSAEKNIKKLEKWLD